MNAIANYTILVGVAGLLTVPSAPTAKTPALQSLPTQAAASHTTPPASPSYSLVIPVQPNGSWSVQLGHSLFPDMTRMPKSYIVDEFKVLADGRPVIVGHSGSETKTWGPKLLKVTTLGAAPKTVIAAPQYKTIYIQSSQPAASISLSSR